ncbi:MAG: sulfatase-like hydrolase/transferase [Chloroflexi bacterium]|nr:sulfatase-like hydrolase/transferase [Chloroflexota bacterium]
MNLKHLLVAILACFIILLSLRLPVSSASEAQPKRPNILFIAIDDSNTMIGSYGGQAYTPNIDRLADEGMLFSNNYIAAPACNPSRISLLTGLRPSSTGVTSLGDLHADWRDYLADPQGPAYQNYGEGIGEIDSLFDHFRKNGYYVASAGKTYHDHAQLYDEKWDKLRTWQFWPGIGWPMNLPLHGLEDYYSSVTADWGAIENARDPHHSGEFYDETILPDYNNTQDALSILDSVPDDQPFFVGVGFILPHLPFYVPQRMLDMYPPETIQLPAVIPNDLEDIPPAAYGLVSQGGNFYDQTYIFDNDHEWRNVMRHYLASISYVDEQVGKVVDRLEALNLDEDTLIVFWGDHGFHLGGKSHLQKHTLWQEASASPLIIKVPGVTAPGSSTDAVVNAVDIFPTLVELAGLHMPSDFHRDGRSIVPLIEDTQTFWPWPATTYLGKWNQPDIERAAIRTRGWSYIRYDLSDTGPNLEEELYFRIVDPHEWYNLLSTKNGDPTQYHGVRYHLESILQGQSLSDGPPQAETSQQSAAAGFISALNLSGRDPNNDYLVFTIESLPANGRLYRSRDGLTVEEPITEQGTALVNIPGWSASVMYQPDANALSDMFSFSVSDGISTSRGRIDIKVVETPRYQAYLPLLGNFLVLVYSVVGLQTCARSRNEEVVKPVIVIDDTIELVNRGDGRSRILALGQ